jgi:hypothetical protein
MAAPMIWWVSSLWLIKERNLHRVHGGHRVHREELGDGDFFVGAEDFAEGVADFAYSGIGFYRVEEEGH